MAVKDAVTASIVGCINPSLELKREAELGQFSVCERGTAGKEQGIRSKANLFGCFSSNIHDLQRKRQFEFLLFRQIIQGKTELIEI